MHLLGIMRRCVQHVMGRRMFCSGPFSGSQKGGEASENKRLGEFLNCHCILEHESQRSTLSKEVVVKKSSRAMVNEKRPYDLEYFFFSELEESTIRKMIKLKTAYRKIKDDMKK